MKKKSFQIQFWKKNSTNVLPEKLGNWRKFLTSKNDEFYGSIQSYNRVFWNNWSVSKTVEGSYATK